MGHGIVLNRIVPYYGSGKKLRHTIGYTGPERYNVPDISMRITIA
jgi:hypothetical protein